jgi:hypothetical protein
MDPFLSAKTWYYGMGEKSVGLSVGDAYTV